MRTTERLLQSHWGIGWPGHDMRCVRSWHPSVPFRITQLFQEFLFMLVFLKFLTNFQTKSTSFPKSSKIISRQITSPLSNTLKPKLCKIDPH